MGRSLKESLAIIKARANALRARGGKPDVVDDLVDAGVISRGAHEGQDVAGGDDATNGEVGAPKEDLELILSRYKDGEVGPIEAIETGEERKIGGESFYLVRPVGETIDPDATREAEAFGRLCAWPQYVEASPYGKRAKRARRGIQVARARSQKPPFDREAVCFLDIETTGLSPTTYLFLVGLMFWEGGRFVVEQVFARHYAEEPAVLRYVRDTLDRFESVVTYNGGSFDLPFVETRMAANRVPPLEPFSSVDLLYTARRLFRGTLPNCRLGTVERHIRGISRTGDIPGRHIPDAYHDYVRTGDARAMKNVLYHNRMDLFTMAVLVNRLAQSEEPPS
jgi:uncharacterized protein YprB with RNaseH-like and TPR domain